MEYTSVDSESNISGRGRAATTTPADVGDALCLGIESKPAVRRALLAVGAAATLLSLILSSVAVGNMATSTNGGSGSGSGPDEATTAALDDLQEQILNAQAVGAALGTQVSHASSTASEAAVAAAMAKTEADGMASQIAAMQASVDSAVAASSTANENVAEMNAEIMSINYQLGTINAGLDCVNDVGVLPGGPVSCISLPDDTSGHQHCYQLIHVTYHNFNAQGSEWSDGVNFLEAQQDAASRCYRVSGDNVHDNPARERGYLATITSQVEQDHITSMIAEAFAETNDNTPHFWEFVIWLGGGDFYQEGLWTWLDGPERGVPFWQGACESTAGQCGAGHGTCGAQIQGHDVFANWCVGRGCHCRLGHHLLQPTHSRLASPRLSQVLLRRPDLPLLRAQRRRRRPHVSRLLARVREARAAAAAAAAATAPVANAAAASATPALLPLLV